MNTIKHLGIAAFYLITASSFAQSGSMGTMTPAAPMPQSTAPSSMPSSTMPTETMPGATGSSYGNSDSNNAAGNTMPPSNTTGTYNQNNGYNQNGGYTGSSGTTGTYSSGVGGDGYNQYDSQNNPNNVHATPRPASQNYHLYQGN